MDMFRKRVVCLLGSPRAGGNSDQLAEVFADALRSRGAFLELYALRELSFSGCRNLFHCKRGGERCGLADGLSPILEAVREADVLVLSSPIYFTDITSDLKAAIERFFSFLVPGYPTAPVKTRLVGDKTLVLIQTQGEGREAYADLLNRYEKGFRMLGFNAFHLIHGYAVRETGDLAARPDLFTEIENLAAEL